MAMYIVTLVSGIYFADVITGRNVTVIALLLLVCNAVEPAYVIKLYYKLLSLCIQVVSVHMCVHVCVCVYTYVHVCIYRCAHEIVFTYIHVQLATCMCMCLHMCASLCYNVASA